MDAATLQNMTTEEKWNYVFQALGVKEYVDFATSAELQSQFLPLKIIFILFSIFFFFAVMYFYMNSSYLRYQFVQDVTEFFSWQAYGLRGLNKRWAQIMKRTEAGTEPELKLAIIEADDFLYQVMEERGYEGGAFEVLLNSVGRRMLPNYDAIAKAHAVRNSIVYDSDFTLDAENVKRMLSEYEQAIKTIAV